MHIIWLYNELSKVIISFVMHSNHSQVLISYDIFFEITRKKLKYMKIISSIERKCKQEDIMMRYFDLISPIMLYIFIKLIRKIRKALILYIEKRRSVFSKEIYVNDVKGISTLLTPYNRYNIRERGW